MRAVLAASLLLQFVSLACTSSNNPSFPLTTAAAGQALRDMQEHPRMLARPLVIVGGHLDLGFGPASVAARMRAISGDTRIMTVSLFSCWDFEGCRKHLVEEVQRVFPSYDAAETTEVDVIGISMGGLAARFAAEAPLDSEHGRRLRMARLFTFSTPHRGATLADFPAITRLQVEMRRGSSFLQKLENVDAGASYELFPYVRLHDRHVGEINAAPPGRTAWWVDTGPLEDAHIGAPNDERLLADVGRRLRGEKPFTVEPPSPLPE